MPVREDTAVVDGIEHDLLARANGVAPERKADPEAALIAAFAGRITALRTEVAAVRFPRLPVNGEPLVVRFRRPTPEDDEAIREHSTRRIARRKYGTIVHEDQTDPQAVLAWTIYACTVDEDRERIWNNQRLWGDLPVGSGPDFIAHILTMGEKTRCMEAIVQLQDLQVEEEAELGKS